MHRRLRSRATTLAALAASFALALPGAEAQSTGGPTPGDGDWSVSFRLFEPDATTGFEIARMFGDRTNIGLTVDITSTDTETTIDAPAGTQQGERSVWRVRAGPSLRWYGDRSSPVSPFLRGELVTGVIKSHVDANGQRQNEQEVWQVEGSLAVGAEWYPLRQLGISGHTGIRWTREDIDFLSEPADATADETSTRLATFHSGLSVSFYFR